MKECNERAFPYVVGLNGIAGGLTKREYIATHILAGYGADSALHSSYEKAAEWAVQQADALLKELAK